MSAHRLHSLLLDSLEREMTKLTAAYFILNKMNFQKRIAGKSRKDVVHFLFKHDWREPIGDHDSVSLSNGRNTAAPVKSKIVIQIKKL
jgi:hypothetical protein